MDAERWLTVRQMAEISGFSLSYFYTNRCLAKNGRRAAVLPEMVGIGRNLRCKESKFFAWMTGEGDD